LEKTTKTIAYENELNLKRKKRDSINRKLFFGSKIFFKEVKSEHIQHKELFKPKQISKN